MGGLGGQWGDPATAVGHAGTDLAPSVFREGRTDSLLLGSVTVFTAHAVIHAASSASPGATDAGGVARFSAAFSAEVG